MTVSRYSGNFKERTDVFDQITPNAVVQSNVSVPAGEWKPAAWLPIQWVNAASEDAFVISTGKVVSFDATGRIVPSGLRIKMVAGGLTYTQNDIDYGVIDLTTGLPVATAGARTADVVRLALLNQGLVSADEVDESSATEVIERFISLPVGVCAYDVYVWAGDSPASLKFTNYQKQHLIAFFTDIQLKMAYMASTAVTNASFDMDPDLGLTATSYTTGVPIADGTFYLAAEAVQFTRYASLMTAASPVVAFGLNDRVVAKNTTRTPVTCDDASVLIRERSSIALINTAGDWYLDDENGVIFIHSTTYAALVAADTVITFSYDAYGTTGAAGERFVHLDGVARPGDFVTFDADSNFVATRTLTAGTILGRVVAIVREPVGLLDRVRTAWNGSNMSASSKMPGTATAGYTDTITLSSETVADKVAIVNVKVG